MQLLLVVHDLQKFITRRRASLALAGDDSHEQRSKANKKRANRKEKIASVDPAATSDAQKEWDEAFELGEVPSAQNTRTVDQWEDDKEDELSVDDIDRVVWAFIKWDDLGYDEGKHYYRLRVVF